MELKFELPDYCENCPVMNLSVNNIFEDEYDLASGVLLSTQPKPELYCIHEEVCALWQEIKSTEKSE
jgi:hypothetical protein